MDEANIRHFLNAAQVSVRGAIKTGNRKKTVWLNVSCPFAPWTHEKGTDSHPSFGITINDAGRSHYRCLTCGMKGRLAGIVTKLGRYRDKDYSKLRHWAELTELQSGIGRPIPNWDDDSLAIDYKAEPAEAPKAPMHVNDAGFASAVGHPYLRQRGIDWVTTFKLDLRFDEFQRRVLFPCYNRYDEFCGFTGRSVLKGNNATRGNNPKVRDYYGLDKRAMFLRMPGRQQGRKLIGEGLFDYGRFVRAGFNNAHGILGTSLTEEKIDILLEEADPCFFFMDNDQAGWQALFGVHDEKSGELNTENGWAWRLYRELPVWIVPYPSDFDKSDPGSLAPARIRNAVKKAWLFTGKPPYNEVGGMTLRHPKDIY